MRSVLIVVLLLFPTLAFAQPGVSPPAASSQPIEVTPIKSGTTATALAIGGTLGGFALLYAGAQSGADALVWPALFGIVAGPSFGHVYAGEHGHAVGMTLLRTAGGAAATLGLLGLVLASDCDPEFEGPCSGGNGRAQAMFWLGTATFIGATIYDVVDAHRAARRANERHARPFMIAPSLVSTANSTRAPALALTGRF